VRNEDALESRRQQLLEQIRDWGKAVVEEKGYVAGYMDEQFADIDALLTFPVVQQ
jgi:hypothetical protein